MPLRRQFMAGAAGMAAALSFSPPALAQTKPRIVVIGGGAGGASVVRFLGESFGDVLSITLIEPKATYATCFYSNLYLGGFVPFDALQFTYDDLARLPGVSVVKEPAAVIEPDRKRIRLTGGDWLAYDRLVVSPGIALDYDALPGWSKDAETRMPHGWQGGEQTRILRSQLDAVQDGGLVVIIAPPNPYRCPPGPYERASMIAHQLVSSGRSGARILILDTKETYSKQGLFQAGWEQHYPGMIEWLPPTIHGGIKSVDPSTMSVATDFEVISDAALVNVIPRQTAGQVALGSGLADDSGYCPIDPFTMKSQRDGSIFILGDAAIGGDMPKSAFSANSQAGVVASMIGHELLDRPAPEVVYNNQCWSLIAKDDGVFVGGDYHPTKEKILQTANMISALEDSAMQRRQNQADGAAWFNGLTSEVFG